MTIDQAPRLLSIASPLGDGVLVLRRLTVHEAIGRPFLIEAEAISENDSLTLGDLIGQAITCTVRQGETVRAFHGIVRAFGRAGSYGRGLTAYRIEAVPELWTLSRTADCRIFQEKSVKQIVETVLAEAGLSATFLGSPPTAPRPYCVQYNETDLDFVQRLLDEVGCGYFFEHAEGSHALKITSANADFPLAPCGPLVHRPNGDTFDSVVAWAPRGDRRPGKVLLKDYDQMAPDSLLEAAAGTVLKGAQSTGGELFLWPGGQAVRPDADVARLLMETEEAQASLVEATLREPRVFAGSRVKIKPTEEGGEVTWLVTAARHEAFDETQLAGGGGAGYSCAVTLMDPATPWRNPAPRPRPRMPGLQSAIVTGPPGEEIYVDKQGRIKVQFLWDREGKRDEKTSCWIRVMQPVAGAWGGTWFLPRIGDEVIVGYLDDDPDKPIVVGSAYHGEVVPPFGALPSSMNKGGLATRSTKGGGADNANILRFDDTRGSEELYVQAEKDLNVLVKNDRTETVKGSHTETVTKDRSVTVEQGNQSLVVSKGDMETRVEMGNQSVVISMGNQDTRLDLGKATTEAMQSIELKVGQSSVRIDQTGVTIKGLTITIEGTTTAEVKSPMTQVKGDGMLILKGGIAMIN
nr:type VI secretion system tip protein TssI/VgrG [Caldovatus aquaticus]